MKNVIINEELIQGKPKEIIEELKKEMILQIAQFDLNNSNYEMFNFNMQLFGEIFEIIGDHSNEKMITLKYNPMGAWYYSNEESEGAE